MKTKKYQKPTKIDLSLKYICPECFSDHWLFLREVKTPNYKIVCECGTIIKPKPISKLRIIYKKKQELSQTIINNCVNNLIDLGFDKSESKQLIIKAYKQIGHSDVGSLVKQAIILFGEKNNV